MQKLLLLPFLLLAFATTAQAQHQDEHKYVGTTNSKIYHYTHCRWAKKIHADNLVVFADLQAAKDDGRRACKVCGPPGSTTATKKKAAPAPIRSSPRTVSVRCSGTTAKGNRCKRKTKSANGRCYQHGG